MRRRCRWFWTYSISSYILNLNHSISYISQRDLSTTLSLAAQHINLISIHQHQHLQDGRKRLLHLPPSNHYTLLSRSAILHHCSTRLSHLIININILRALPPNRSPKPTTSSAIPLLTLSILPKLMHLQRTRLPKHPFRPRPQKVKVRTRNQIRGKTSQETNRQEIASAG
jgi:hypothetical protein